MRSTVISTHQWRVPPSALAVALVVVAVLVAHVATAVTAGASPLWDLSRDRSVGEWLGYVLVVAAAGQLAVLAVAERAPVLAAWAVVLAVVVLDDALLLHERAGGRLVLEVGLPPVAGLRPQDLGELLVWGAMTGPLLVLLLTAHVRAAAADRRRSRVLACLFVLFAAFAVGVDVLHQVVGPDPGTVADLVLGTVEDGGELVVAAVLALTVRGWLRRRAPSGRGRLDDGDRVG